MLRRFGRETMRAIAFGAMTDNPDQVQKPDPEPIEHSEPAVTESAVDFVSSINQDVTKLGNAEIEHKEKQPGSLTVTIFVENNLENKAGKVVGMNGRQSLDYLSLGGKTFTETQKVNWLEDSKVTKDELPYEHPAEPASFDLFKRPAGWDTTYLLMSDHPEGAITIHGLGKRSRSEGCILASDTLRRLIEREAADQKIHVDILPITDLRSADEIAIAPLPYSTK